MYLRKELNELCALVEGAHSNPALLVGDRGSGKTYLMQMLRDRQEWSTEQIRYVPSYLDAGDVATLPPNCNHGGFWKTALKPLKVLLEQPEFGNNLDLANRHSHAESADYAHPQLTDLFTALRDARIRLVLLLDRLPHILRCGQLMTEAFWNSFRSIVSNHFSSLALVAASVQSRELLENKFIARSDTWSPFLNLLTSRHLHPLDEHAVNELLNQTSIRICNEAERRFIYRFGGGNLRFTLALRDHLCWLPAHRPHEERISRALNDFWQNGRGWCESIWKSWTSDDRARMLRVTLHHLHEILHIQSLQVGRPQRGIDVYSSPKFRYAAAKLIGDMLQTQEMRQMLLALNIAEADIAINDSLPASACASNLVEYLFRVGSLDDAFFHIYELRHRRRHELVDFLHSWGLVLPKTISGPLNASSKDIGPWAAKALPACDGCSVRSLLMLQWISEKITDGVYSHNHSISAWLQYQIPESPRHFLDWCEVAFQAVCQILPLDPKMLISYGMRTTEMH